MCVKIEGREEGIQAFYTAGNLAQRMSPMKIWESWDGKW